MVPAALAAPTPDSPDAVLNAVKNGPNAKIGPWLGNLYEEYRAAVGKGIAAKAFKTTNPMVRVSKGSVGIDAYATDAAALTKSLRALGATKIKARGPLVSAQVPVKALGQIAALSSLRSARPVLATTNALPAKAVSQGDLSLNGPAARLAAGVDGTGLTVGTLSDSFNCNPGPFQPGAPTTTFAEDLSNDELPTDTTILDNGACPGSDEGRGMAQLIHDVAPGAAISFHTAFNSEFDFAEGIIELADAGADVIVDDVRYFAEPFFSDGMIAQAVDIVAGRGVPYYSSAGNQARNSYENDFSGINIRVNAGKNLNGGKAVVRRFHNFGTAQAPAILQPVFLQPTAEAGFTIFSFQWDQPHLTATTYARLKAGQDPALAVGAESDLDLVFFDHKGHVIRLCPPGVARGITCQITGDRNIGGDAVDIAALFYSGPPKTAQLFFIGFVVNGGPDPGVVKYSWFDSQGVFGMLDFDTQSGTSFGHSNAAGNQAIGAASWYVTEPFSTSGLVPPNDTQTPAIDLSPCAPACLNDFSSAGGIPILFDRFGTRLAEPEVRLVPSVTGPDGGNTSFFFSDSSYDDDDGDGLNSPFSLFISGLDQPGDEFPNFFGTSASAPHIAAVAALMLEKKPDLTVEEIRETLQSTARPLTLRFTSARPTITFPIDETGPGDYDFDSGFGLVDAAAALEAIGD
ncbi:MAG TPA: S8 family serine peptidase [Steroidobacteraceae bacterium]